MPRQPNLLTALRGPISSVAIQSRIWREAALRDSRTGHARDHGAAGNRDCNSATGTHVSAREILRRTLHHLEICFDWVKLRIKRRFGLFDPIHIFPYRGFGNRQHARLLGRVLETKEIGQANRNDSWWRNALAMARRFMTDEIPGIRVRGTCLGQTCEATSDSEGYFQLQFDFAERHSTPERWIQVDLELLDTVTPNDQLSAAGELLIPPEDAQFGVVSDIDDTILQSSATDLWRMAWLTFSNNAYTRTPFPRVASFYQALAAGSQGRGPNPIFYVSSSVWNLYDLLAQFMELQQIPRGPILLRDLGLDDKKFIASGHDHKLDKIGEIMDYYPGLPFLLIGDSGQRDPWLYREVVRQHPGVSRSSTFATSVAIAARWTRFAANSPPRKSRCC